MNTGDHMKIILQRNLSYYAINCETSRWSSVGYPSTEEALSHIQDGPFNNPAITNCTSEVELLGELLNYTVCTLVEFIDDTTTPYEYW